MTQIRLKVYLTQSFQQEAVISQLTSVHGLVVNITGTMLGVNRDKQEHLDLELKGTPQQINNGLTYLQKLHLNIVGKANTAGDSWYY